MLSATFSFSPESPGFVPLLKVFTDKTVDFLRQILLFILCACNYCNDSVQTPKLLKRCQNIDGIKLPQTKADRNCYI